MMKQDGPIDYAVFQLSPRRSRCELLISSNGNTEKLASGLIKPFIAQLKVAEEQFAKTGQHIKLEVGKGNHGETWFTKGTLERFVRFVSTPEILELASNFDAEMSQLEAARKIYLQANYIDVTDIENVPIIGTGISTFRCLRAPHVLCLYATSIQSPASMKIYASIAYISEDEAGSALAADASKKELLRAIDLRLAAVRQQLATACARACAAGFHPDNVSELTFFADFFGADRLNEACTKYLLLCQRRPDLLPEWRTITYEQVRTSYESDMSIDDPTEDLTIPMKQLLVNKNCSSTDLESRPFGKNEIDLDQSKASISDQLKSFSSFVSDRKNDSQRTEDDKKDQPSVAEPVQTSQPARRLSVQDRINLFESKQKENFGSGSGSVSKPVVSKSVELRKMSSDVSATSSAVEKAVLRRWSGTSDMSVDFGADKKDFGDSPQCIPASTSVSQAEGHAASTPFEDTHQKGHHDSAGCLKLDGKSLKVEIVDTGLENQSDSSSNTQLLGKSEGSSVSKGSMVDGSVSSQAWSSVREQQRENSYKENSEQKEQPLLGSGDGDAKEQLDSKVQLTSVALEIENKAASVSSALDTLSNSNRSSRKIETGRAMDHDRLKESRASQSKIRGLHGHSRSFSGRLEGSSGLKFRETQEKGSSGVKLGEQTRGRSFTGESEGGGVEKVQIIADDSSMQRLKSSKTIPVGTEQIKKAQGKRDDGVFSSANSKAALSSRKVSESHESSSVPPPSQSEPQRARQSKGNRDLNDELKMKADELEKLFAEHKLRAPGDQSGSVRRSKPADLQKESPGSSQLKKSSLIEAAPSSLPEKSIKPEATVLASSVSCFPTPMNLADAEESSSSLRRNLSDLSYSDKSRGKFYEKYMKRRDAKLKEEWGSKGPEKEAKLKAMHDRLEQSSAEMKAKFSGSAERQQPSHTAHQGADKVRSFSWRSNVTKQQMDLNQSEEKESGMFSELDFQDDLFGESHGGDLDFRSAQIKKALPTCDLDSSNARSTAIPVSRSSAKGSYSSGRRKTPYDNPLAQSVPNFSELKKENTKPSSGSGFSKVAPRTQVRSYARSRNANEETPLVKEEKTRRTQSVWKGSADPADCSEFSTSKFDGNTLEVDIAGQGKSNGAVAAKNVRDMRFKAAIPSEIIMDESSIDAESMADHMLVVARGEDDEEPGTVAVPNTGRHDGKSRPSPELNYSLKSGSVNGNSLPASAADLTASMSLKYQAGDPLRDSPNESPLYWNSGVHHLFSYPHDASDIDASADSPVGSPASWNSHTLGQTEGDSARMRKKWGSASKPLFAANTSHGHSRKDVTKGFKRLLKFGRKSRGTESLVDWISATTSEGDDDTEDGRDYANRSSEDLRKSRMGFQQGHPSDYSLNESEFLNEHVEALCSSIPALPANFKLREDLISGSSLKAPKSFFSLSTFRGKGSDTKPR